MAWTNNLWFWRPLLHHWPTSAFNIQLIQYKYIQYFYYSSKTNSYYFYSIIHKLIFTFLHTHQVTTSNIYTQPPQIKAIHTYYNTLKNKSNLIPTKYLSKLMWRNLPTTQSCPAIWTFHLQIYSFLKIYSILMFMNSMCRGGWCIYLISTGSKILVFIQWLIQLDNFYYGIDCTFVSVLITIKHMGKCVFPYFEAIFSDVFFM